MRKYIIKLKETKKRREKKGVYVYLRNRKIEKEKVIIYP